jgi:ABC-type lipoprotein release transport system permease subunit
MKDIMKAVMIRALCVITAAAIFATYARIMASVRERNGRLAVEAQKAQAKMSVTVMSGLLDALRDEIVNTMPKYEAADEQGKLTIKQTLLDSYACQGTVISSNVRDIYLTSVRNMVDRALTVRT